MEEERGHIKKKLSQNSDFILRILIFWEKSQNSKKINNFFSHRASNPLPSSEEKPKCSSVAPEAGSRRLQQLWLVKRKVLVLISWNEFHARTRKMRTSQNVQDALESPSWMLLAIYSQPGETPPLQAVRFCENKIYICARSCVQTFSGFPFKLSCLDYPNFIKMYLFLKLNEGSLCFL